MSNALRIQAATGLDRGDRDYQQDQLCLLPHARTNGCLLGVVADGMGGRSGGRKASDQVMLTAKQLFERYDPGTDKPQEFLGNLVNEAHLVIRLTATAAEEEPHSTVAAFLLNPEGDCHWVHAGDSRIYHFRNGKLQHRTQDPSLVQMLVERGELSEQEAQHDARSNILMGCLGSDKAPPQTFHTIQKMQAGDVLLACSDGLWHYFLTEEIGKTLALLTPQEACPFLIQKAKQRAEGSGDNISVILVKWETRSETQAA
jgi:serine/threonine protein phosphatase PrpC